MRQRLPSFIIGGAPRCGTTWLYHLADRHPKIYMARPVAPEPKFFLLDDLYQKGLAHYAGQWFGNAPTGALLGEKSTNYLENAVVAQRLGRDLPDVRLIFVLRNPIDRAFSNYLWSCQNGLETESFDKALELEGRRCREQPERWRYSQPFSYLRRGLYDELLKPWLEQFSRSRLLILIYEAMLADPTGTAAKLHTFLGVPERPEDGLGLGPINAVHNPERVCMRPETRQWLATYYAASNRRLRAVLRAPIVEWDA
ncbi:MAG: sulfotransferase [Magnetococcales bacterium]|nr:sulfotransferase [Magnetococcales bacterium]